MVRKGIVGVLLLWLLGFAGDNLLRANNEVSKSPNVIASDTTHVVKKLDVKKVHGDTPYNLWLYILVFLSLFGIVYIVYEVSLFKKDFNALINKINRINMDLKSMREKTGTPGDMVILQRQLSMLEKSMTSLEHKVVTESKYMKNLEEKVENQMSLLLNKHDEIALLIQDEVSKILGTINDFMDRFGMQNMLRNTYNESASSNEPSTGFPKVVEVPVMEETGTPKEFSNIEDELAKWKSLRDEDKKRIKGIYESTGDKRLYDPLLEGETDITMIDHVYELFNIIKTDDPKFINMAEGTIIKTLKPAVLTRDGLIVNKGEILVK